MKKNRIIGLLTTFIFFFNLSFAQITKDAQAFYDQGILLKEQKKVTEALEKFKQAIFINPHFSEAQFQAGWCQNELKNYSSAIEYLRQAREILSLIPKVHFELGYAFEKNGNSDSALKSYSRCTDLKPDYTSAYKQSANIAFSKEDYASALDYYKKYEEFTKPEITDYLFWYRKGYTQNMLKDYNRARINLRKSLQYKNDYINTHLELGYACTKLKQDDEAIIYFKSAMLLDTLSPIPYNSMAVIYRDNKNDMVKAMEWYQKALVLKPMDSKAHFGMGYCLNATGKYNEAVDHLKKAVETEPTYTAAYTELGYSYYKLDKNADALTQLDKAISLNPKNVNARYYSCLIFIKQKNKTKAQKIVDELKALSPNQATALQEKVDAL